MRRLLPLPHEDDVDLDVAYALPTVDGPYVRANMVASADGAAQADGRSAGLSSPADKRLFSVLRGLADVVLVGAATVRMEGYGPARPSAERRERRRAAGRAPVPPIAVVTRDLRLDPATPFFTEATARPLIVTCAASPSELRREFEPVADVLVIGEQSVDLGAALAELADRGLPHVLTEGGPRLLAELLGAGRLDELCLTISPLAFAGSATRIVNGPALPHAARFGLAHVLEDDGSLFLRYGGLPR